MILWPNENAAQVISSQPAHAIVAPRTRSVRGLLRRSHSSTITEANAAGSSQAIWPPPSAVDNRLSWWHPTYRHRRRQGPKRGVGPTERSTGPAGRAESSATPTGDAARLVAGQSTEPVVAEHELQERVVLAPTDVRSRIFGSEFNNSDPPTRRHHQNSSRCHQITKPLLPARRSRSTVMIIPGTTR